MYPHCLAVMVEPLDDRAARPASRCRQLALAGRPVSDAADAAARLRARVSRLRAVSARPGGRDVPSRRLPRAWRLSGGTASPPTICSGCGPARKSNVLLVPGDLFYYRIARGTGDLERRATRGTMPGPPALAWRMLNSPDCPLTGDALERAQAQLRVRPGARRFRLSQASATSSRRCAILRYAGLDAADWIRYLRPPRRNADAGTPPTRHESAGMKTPPAIGSRSKGDGRSAPNACRCTSRGSIEREEAAVRRVLVRHARRRRRRATGASSNGCSRESTGARGVLAVNSCTAALEIAIEIAGLGRGDEVILPSFTFVSTANAVLKAGARPVFADIDPVTLGLDPADVERAASRRGRARSCRCTTPGMACDMAALDAIAARHRPAS